MAIKFTQFMRPNGRRETTEIDRPPEIEALAQQCNDAGVQFESEVLMNGIVSFEAVGPVDEEGDPSSLAMELVPNGPGVLDAVDRLVRTAHANLPKAAE